MKNWRRIALGSVAAIVIAALVTLLAVRTLVSPERLAQKAREEARAAWSRDLSVGTAALHFWPRPTLYAENVALANPPWAKSPQLLGIDRVSARLELLPLLIGKVRFASLQLEGVKASLEVAADGVGSWELKARSEPADPPTLAALEIRKADLSYRPHGGAVSQWHIDQVSVEGAPGLRDGRIEASISRKLQKVPLQVAGRFNLDNDRQGEIAMTDLALTLGKLHVTGSGTFSQSGNHKVLRASLETERLDWVQALLDAGEPPLPPLPPEELFHDNALAWPLLAAMRNLDGAIELKIGRLWLRNGVELTNARAQMQIDGARLKLAPFSADLLGGSAKGTMQFDARNKSMKVEVQATNLLLERWFHERGSVIAFTGGPMRLNASLTATGDSMKALAASSTGPVLIRMGRGVWASPKAGHAEDVMVRSLSDRESQQIEFECITAALPFVAGRAAGKLLIGARSSAASLLTSGYVDLRDETIDLRGPVRGHAGSVGLATIADDMKITGPIRRPKASIDPAGTAKAVARVGAAILTAGATLVGTAAANAKKSRESDPCQAVLEGSTMPQLAALK